jgi:hypothetical protein
MSRTGMIKGLMNYGIDEHYNLVDGVESTETVGEHLKAELNVLISMTDNELTELFEATIDNDVIELLSC